MVVLRGIVYVGSFRFMMGFLRSAMVDLYFWVNCMRGFEKESCWRGLGMRFVRRFFGEILKDVLYGRYEYITSVAAFR